MALVEEAGSSARCAASLRDAVAAVLEAVAVAANWPAAHSWDAAEAGTEWVSSGLWFPDDAIGLGILRRASVEAPPAPARGHLALALHLQGTQWVPDLSGTIGTDRYDAAVAAGMRSAVACPVYAHGRPVAILEWYLATSERPAPDVVNVLGHLSAVLSEVAERPVVVPAPRADLREAVRWATEEGVMARLLTC
ncbi:MAG TPA: hypothetical protein VGX28_00250 [Frankiaceae bacterium]|jgi:hypothetical protein|nr:hypothetical protein [Frankiaceae bacterium]